MAPKAGTEISPASLSGPRPPCQACSRRGSWRCSPLDPLLPTLRDPAPPRALLYLQSTYRKSQSTESGPTASARRTQTTSAARNLCGCGSKASAPAPSARPSAPRPPPLARVVLAVGLGTRKGIGPRACHIIWVGFWDKRHRDGRPGGMGTVTAAGSVDWSSAPFLPFPSSEETRSPQSLAGVPLSQKPCRINEKMRMWEREFECYQDPI